jgi:hypothetical protein
MARAGYNAAAVLVLLVMVFPIYWMVATGFKRGVDILSFEPKWLPIPGTLENFRSAVGKPFFLQDVRNSLVVVVATVLISLVLAFLAALAAARFRFRGRAALVVVGAGGSRLGRRAALDSGRFSSELMRMTVVSPMATRARIASTSRWSRARARGRGAGARWRGGVRCMPETSQPTLMPR